MANGNGEGKLVLGQNAPVWVVAVVVVLKVVFDFVGPALGMDNKPAPQSSVDQLADKIGELTTAVSKLSELEERRMQRTELTYRPDEWRAMVKQVDEIHQDTTRRRKVE